MAGYQRILLKISGEGFAREGSFGIESSELENIARQCVEVAKMGVQLAIVVGGGVIVIVGILLWRRKQSSMC